ncbi:hypothetical protein [Streptomyces omiyaensis]|uniref:hypothetical protein n=1 Tax=Streptomyces omiyaensis TaxID=68247 RepID=UPI0036FF7FB5
MSMSTLAVVVVLVLLALLVFSAVAAVLHPDTKAANRAMKIFEMLLRFIGFIRQ